MSAVIAFAGARKSREAHISGFCPEGVGASGGYDGCDGLRSGPEISDLDSPGVLWTLVLLPVPGSLSWSNDPGHLNG
ncbi:hypothetical protein CU668_26065 [Pseudomonas syringae pv. actinidifoliorum]|nr:hypothetical protein [Pseudomonas syringae pv. actinidifoliorum]